MALLTSTVRPASTGLAGPDQVGSLCYNMTQRTFIVANRLPRATYATRRFVSVDCSSRDSLIKQIQCTVGVLRLPLTEIMSHHSIHTSGGNPYQWVKGHSSVCRDRLCLRPHGNRFWQQMNTISALIYLKWFINKLLSIDIWLVWILEACAMKKYHCHHCIKAVACKYKYKGWSLGILWASYQVLKTSLNIAAGLIGFCGTIGMVSVANVINSRCGLSPLPGMP